MITMRYSILLLSLFSSPAGSNLIHACECTILANGDYPDPFETDDHDYPWLRYYTNARAQELGDDLGNSTLNMGDLVLVKPFDNKWLLQYVDEYFGFRWDWAGNDKENVKRVKSFLGHLYQKNPSANQFLELIQQVQKDLPQPLETNCGSLQALIISPNSRIINTGDIHGDYHSLLTNAHVQYHKELLGENLTIASNCFYVFTGDYGDRGFQGINVLSFLLKLKRLNPHNLFLLRGNHESPMMATSYGLQNELEIAYGSLDGKKVLHALLDLFCRFPHVLLIGTRRSVDQHFDFGFFCHGGIEERLTIKLHELINEVIKKNIQEEHSPTLITSFFSDVPGINGLNWSDFYADGREGIEEVDRGICKSLRRIHDIFDYDRSASRHYLQDNLEQSDLGKEYQYSIKMIGRGHGHIPGGVVELLDHITDDQQHWQPLQSEQCYPIQPYSVFTCTSSPEGLWGAGCKEDAFAVIDIDSFGNWSITPHIQQR